MASIVVVNQGSSCTARHERLPHLASSWLALAPRFRFGNRHRTDERDAAGTPDAWAGPRLPLRLSVDEASRAFQRESVDHRLQDAGRASPPRHRGTVPTPPPLADTYRSLVDRVTQSAFPEHNSRRNVFTEERRYKIRNGDSLESLADRFWGAPERWREIYAANRDVLEYPDVLPLDAIITIPARDRAPPDDGDVVPIPRGLYRRPEGNQ